MKELQIIVAGEAGSGKSTITLLLEEFLKEKGFDVELQLENELIDYGSEMKFRMTCSLDWDKKLNHLKTTRKIILKQVQTMRNGSIKKESI